MNFDFTENTVIVIPLIFRGYRLEGAEKVRFRCLFKNSDGDFPYTLDIEEDNKGEDGEDGKYTVTLDMGRYGIIPGRYDFDLSLVLESGSLVTIMPKNDNHINVIPETDALYKPNGEMFFGADYDVESGKTGEWNYRKKVSGIAECWGKVSFFVETISDLSGKGVMTNAVGYLPLPPELFKSAECVICIPVSPRHTVNSTSVISSKSAEIILNCGVENEFDIKSGDEVEINCFVGGYWK